ncbi:RNA polymerase sigma factor [Cryptosporangium aurantiacum]|uniref:RNA polymerase, sigma subunit, ECF family n=1 Tax=Cryptosporangium aurantiacum TaxID=134849 RepID=A0A1M7N7Y1_9ACTN|nr:sigma-70 family RNA polymerase sigma factor [Cryptosporangium aurantiacum]SHM99173.1 RNA polymerase, sigma subunit, ECF family [Cryptosporangium aurantiacum]
MTSGSNDVVTKVWRDQSSRVVGGLLRMTHDLDLAEDLASDALVAALEQWPATGVPDNPGAWLMSVAKRRAIDHFRRAERYDRLAVQLAPEAFVPDFDAAVDHIEDDVLRLMLVTCHPALTTESQIALTLRLLGGLTTKEIGRAFLVPEQTVVRRITRAKRTLAEAGTGLDDLDRTEQVRRLPSVLQVIYLIFTEGYSATAGDDWMRPALCDEAIRLARLVADIVPREPEPQGLLALMYFQASRLPARTDDAGNPVLLADQDRDRWDQLAIRRGIEALGACLRAGGTGGVYGLQAAIAAEHAIAPNAEATNWTRIARLYDELAVATPSPVVRLNRAVARGMADGPAVGLRLVDELTDEPALREYHLLPSIRGDLLAKLGRREEARAEFERAAGLARNTRERAFLTERAASLR